MTLSCVHVIQVAPLLSVVHLHAMYTEVFEEMFLSNYPYEISFIYKKYQRWIHYPGDKTEFDFSSEDTSSYSRYQFYCLCSEPKL